MLRTIVVLYFLVLVCQGFSQNWLSLRATTFIEEMGERTLPVKYQLAEINLDEMLRALQQGQVDVMLPDGTLRTFQATRHSNFAQTLQQRYPDIHTYLLQDISNKLINGRLDLSARGLHAVLQHPDGEIYIDPFTEDDHRYYLIYHTKDYRVDPEIRALYNNHEHHFLQSETDFLNQKPVRSPFARGLAEEVILRTFRIAISATGEYTQKHNGTKAGALAAINTALSRINFVLESELAIRLQLVESNDDLIFLNGDDDPFSNGNASQMALENNNYLIANLGTTNYDVGHVFGTNCSNVVGTSGGIGIVCNASMKGFGSSCEISGNDRFYIGIVCHELGHQFGAEHTWNNCPSAPDGQFNSRTAFEPGSGSTIMSYAGACGNQNIAFDSDNYYHSNSIEDIQNFLKNSGDQCAESTLTGNHNPTVTIDLEGGFFIPVRTPFKLTARANDEDGDTITYSWEQFDPGVGVASLSPIENPKGDAPIFRSQRPDPDPTRYFPGLDNILNNNYNNTEVLPTYDRRLTFRATVRDHVVAGGGIAWDQLTFRATQQAGPFTVIDSLLPDSLSSGSYIEIKWDVARTNLFPVNCQAVNILLSVDSGQTYNYPLITNTVNDGSEFVLIPDVATESARIMVEAADNIFFDINDSALVISKSDQAGFAIDLVPHVQTTCLPSTVALTLESFATGNFQDSFYLVNAELPSDVTVISGNEFFPGDDLVILLDFFQVITADDYTLSFDFTSALGDTITRSVQVKTLSSDFSSLSLREPSQGLSSVSTRPTFSWEGSTNADKYILEVSKSPAFDQKIVAETQTITTIVLDTLLDENTLYYWRVRPENSCGQGAFTHTSAFHTINLSCEEFSASDLPKVLSQSGIVVVKSDITLMNTGTLSDVNITSISGFHDSFGDLIFSLQSPSGTTATLIRKQCGFTNKTFTLGFDDQSLLPFDCQAVFNGQSFQPMESLSIFEEEEIEGVWSLIVADSVIGSGGRIDSWSLELCGTLTPIPPTVSTLDTLSAQYAGQTVLDDQVVELIHSISGPVNLLFTLVTIPAKGLLQLNGDVLLVGSQFSQLDLNQGNVLYQHTGLDSLPDSFIVTVIDGQGGWIGPLTIPIKVYTEIVATHDHQLRGFTAYPNPVQNILYIHNERQYSGDAIARIYSLGGTVIQQEKFHLSDLQSIDLERLIAGIYLLQIATPEGVAHLKFIKK